MGVAAIDGVADEKSAAAANARAMMDWAEGVIVVLKNRDSGSEGNVIFQFSMQEAEAWPLPQ